jgi:glycosyltransferase involved in cell wall biosynthesis
MTAMQRTTAVDKTNIMVLCHAVVGTRMASPGIRSTNLARVLSQQLPDAHVTLSVPSTTPNDLDPSTVPYEFVTWTDKTLVSLAKKQDIIVSPSRFPLKILPFVRDKKLVLDLYTPFFTEWMEMTKYRPGERHRRAWMEMKRKDLIMQLAYADAVLCSNERQRDLLVGIMGTCGLITPRAYDENPTLERLVKIAPMGMRATPPVKGPPLLRGGRFPGIGPDDFVMIWNGTIVEWYDLELLIRALHRIVQRHPNVKLFFMGTEHPDSYGSEKLRGLGAGATRTAMALSEELGLLDKNVIFNFDWASNEETEQFLLESDLSVCTYWDSLETRYSFRVRYLDCLWASLPMVMTRGDIFAEMVDDQGLGLTVGEGDLDGLTAALERMVSDHEFRDGCRRNISQMRDEFTWERTLEPLVEFCRNPESALIRRSEQTLPIALRTLDWLGSRAHLEARFHIPGHIKGFAHRTRARLKG